MQARKSWGNRDYSGLMVFWFFFLLMFCLQHRCQRFSLPRRLQAARLHPDCLHRTRWLNHHWRLLRHHHRWNHLDHWHHRRRLHGQGRRISGSCWCCRCSHALVNLCNGVLSCVVSCLVVNRACGLLLVSFFNEGFPVSFWTRRSFFFQTWAGNIYYQTTKTPILLLLYYCLCCKTIRYHKSVTTLHAGDWGGRGWKCMPH